MSAPQATLLASKERRYNVVLTGSVRPGFEVGQVESALAQLAKIDLAKAKALLNGKPHVVKSNVDQSTATQFQSKFEAIGARCAVKPVDAPGPALVNTTSSNAAISTGATNTANSISTRTIKEFFVGQISPIATTAKYRAGLIFVAVAMVLLPILYVALVLGVAIATVWHTLNDWDWMTRPPYWNHALWYLALTIAGLISIVFMIKPLFAPAERTRRPLALNRQEDALFFAFVEQIAQRIGVPMPLEIQVDNSVNASAGAKHGLLGVFSGQLVLTVGLPLIGGLSARSLAGVIAHELGHFAQSAGMKFSYTIGAINHWLARCVYERDAWDEQLDEWVAQYDDYRGGFLKISKAAVWVTRKMLLVAMNIGVLVSRAMARQMEFDADRYEASLAGSKTFRETVVRLHELNAAEEIVGKRLGRVWDDTKKLSDNYPKLVVDQSKALPERFRTSIDASIAEEKAQRMSTHPTDRDRIANAESLSAPGIFSLDAVGAAFLPRYERLCKQASLMHYRTLYGVAIKPDQLLSSLEAPAETDTRTHDDEKLKIYMAGLFWPSRFLKIRRPTAFVAPELTETKLMLNDMVGKLRVALPQYAAALERYKAAQARRWGASANDGNQADQSLAQELSEFEAVLSPFETTLSRRFEIALATRTDAQTQDETFYLEKALAALTKVREAISKLHGHSVALAHAAGDNADASPDIKTKLSAEIQTCADEYRSLLNAIGDAPYPFDRKNKAQSIADYVRANSGDPEQVIVEPQHAPARIENVWKALEFLHWRIMARFAALAHDAEDRLGVDTIAQVKNNEVKPHTDPDDPALPF